MDPGYSTGFLLALNAGCGESFRGHILRDLGACAPYPMSVAALPSVTECRVWFPTPATVCYLLVCCRRDINSTQVSTLHCHFDTTLAIFRLLYGDNNTGNILARTNKAEGLVRKNICINSKPESV